MGFPQVTIYGRAIWDRFALWKKREDTEIRLGRRWVETSGVDGARARRTRPRANYRTSCRRAKMLARRGFGRAGVFDVA